jgi:hypothetical protein
MARMIPKQPAETGSSAEQRLFERLRDETSDEIVAFHHVAWLAPRPGKRPEEGEADFVLAHPRYGVVVVEVKGGSISYDAKSGVWTSTGKSGTERIKDPVGQARGSSHALARALARAKRSGGERVSYGHAVAFPDTRADKRILKPDLRREILLDHVDLGQIDDRIAELLRGSAGAPRRACGSGGGREAARDRT